MKVIINLGREILLLGSVRESIMTPSETSSEKCFLLTLKNIKSDIFYNSNKNELNKEDDL
jgi:hypothetical protein